MMTDVNLLSNNGDQPQGNCFLKAVGSSSLIGSGLASYLTNHSNQQPLQRLQQQQPHAILGSGSTLTPVNSPSNSHEFAVRLASEANVKAGEKDLYEAIKLYTKAISLHSTDGRFFLNRSFCYAQLELYQLALDDADSAILLDPKSGKSLFRRAQALVGLRKWPEAEKAFQEVLVLDPDCMETAKELVNLRLLALSAPLGLDEDKIRSIPLSVPALELVSRQHSPKTLGWQSNSITASVGNSIGSSSVGSSWDHALNGSSKAVGGPLTNNSWADQVNSINRSNTTSNTTSSSGIMSFEHNHHAIQHNQQHLNESHFRGGNSNTQPGVIGSSIQTHKMQPQPQPIGSQHHLSNGFSCTTNSNGINGWRTIERPNSSSPQTSNTSNSVLNHLESQLDQLSVSNRMALIGNDSVLDGSCLGKQQTQCVASSSSVSTSCSDQLLNSFSGSNSLASSLNSFASAAAFISGQQNNMNSTSIQHQHQELLRQQQHQVNQVQHHQQQGCIGSERRRDNSGGSSSGLGSSSGSAEPPSISPASIHSSEGHDNNSHPRQSAAAPASSVKCSAPVSAWGSCSSSSSTGGTFADIVKKKASAPQTPAAPAVAASINSNCNSNSCSVKNDSPAVTSNSTSTTATGWGDEPTTTNSNSTTCPEANQNGSQNGSTSKRPTNIWGYHGLRVANVSPSASKSTLHSLFSKFGRVKLIDRIVNKNVENQMWVSFDNANSPVDAIAKYQGVVVPGVSLNNTTPLRFYFAATDDQKDLKFSRPKQPQDNRGECYYWRTTNCFSRESCSLRHIPACKNIDAQVWMKMTRESSNSSSSN